MNPSKITYLGFKEDFQWVVILLWRDAQINVLHRIDGKLYTEMTGIARYQYAEIDLFFSRYSTSNYEFYGNFDTAGIGSDWSLVTCTYNGEKWWALRHTNTLAVSMYFMGSTTNISFTKVHYYTSNSGTVVNSEVNGSIVSEGNRISVRSVNGSPYALQKDITALSSVYVKKAGDTMTGDLVVGTGKTTARISSQCVYSYNLDISSTSTFGGTATFNGGMYSGNIFPLSNNNYRIGSNSNRFIDAYIQTWVYANYGLYMNPSGITQNGSYLELSSGGNEIIIVGGTDFYVNYRGASYGGRSVPKKWYWWAGSSSSWANMEFGDCTLHGWINSTGITVSGANRYNVGARFSNTSHDSIEIVGGNYTMGLGCHSNGLWHWWRGTANPTSSTNKSYVMEYDGSTWAFTGSITATAAITAKATSDFRLKENYDGLIDYRERLLKLGRVYDYNYNKKALDLYQDRIDNKRHTGLVYQNAVKAGITNFCHEKDEYGYGSLNYLSPDLIATIIGSVQANILSIRLVESEQERMRKELEHAKSEIKRLKGLVASLQN